MTISVNVATRVIYVPQADLTSLGGGRYEHDINAFRLALKDWEDSDDGMDAPDTHVHGQESTLSGVTYARKLEVINGYTVEYENGTYQVNCVGANHNVGDVKVVNSVSLVIGNSAGLVVPYGGVLNANIVKVNDIPVTGDGQPGTEWGP